MLNICFISRWSDEARNLQLVLQEFAEDISHNLLNAITIDNLPEKNKSTDTSTIKQYNRDSAHHLRVSKVLTPNLC